MRVYRCGGGPATNQRNVFMISATLLGQLFGNVPAVGHEACRLEYCNNSASNRTDTANHAKLAHVCSHSLHVRLLQQDLNLVYCPTGRQPWVFMQEVIAGFSLMIIKLRAESHIAFCLLNTLTEFGHP